MIKHRILLLFLTTFYTLYGICQTKMDFSFLEKHYSQIDQDDAFLSNDGNFFAYKEKIVGTINSTNNLVIRNKFGKPLYSVLGKFENAFGFTNDSRFFVFRDQNSNVVWFLNLITGDKSSLEDIKILFIPRGNYSDKVFFQTLDNQFVSYSIGKKIKFNYGKCNRFEFQNGGKFILVISDVTVSSEKLELLNIENGERHKIAAGGKYSNFLWDRNSQKMVFLERTDKTSIYLFEKKRNVISQLFNDSTSRKKLGREISNLSNYFSDGSALEFGFKQVKNNVDPQNLIQAKVNLWSYFDMQLYPNKPENPNSNINLEKVLLNVASREIFSLRDSDHLERRFMDTFYIQKVKNKKSNAFSVISQSGIRTTLKGLPSSLSLFALKLTADRNFLLYFSNNDWYSYNLNEHHSRCLTKGLDAVWYKFSREDDKNEPVDGFPEMLNGSLLRLTDQTDLWLLDASARRPAVCLTSGYGKKNKVRFRQVEIKGVGPNFRLNGKMLLTALDENDGKRGFFTCSPDYKSLPVKLSMLNINTGKVFASATSNDFFVFCESTSKAPNWFYTHDFSNFRNISNVKFLENDITSELLHGREINGRVVNAILYKPLNFDSTKRYPVIINYYEEGAVESINRFQQIKLIDACINIPWFVKQGYLVVQPDIYFKKGFPGKSALDCVNSIVDEIVKKSYVDSSRLGLNGHSFGGFETYYIATHSKRFRAALAASGNANMITHANSLSGTLYALQSQRQVESGQYNLGATFWERPELYIENSPLLIADKTSLPLLIMHNQNDSPVSFSRGMEFFMAMRRLGKPCWMLEYADEGHVLRNKENQKDYTIRITQFYDYYLRDFHAPLWMLEGMKYKDTRFMSGYELDTTGRIPGPGINSFEEQQKISTYSNLVLSDKMNCGFKAPQKRN